MFLVPERYQPCTSSSDAVVCYDLMLWDCVMSLSHAVGLFC